MKQIFIEKPGFFKCILKNDTHKTVVFTREMLTTAQQTQLFLMNVERYMKTRKQVAQYN